MEIKTLILILILILVTTTIKEYRGGGRGNDGTDNQRKNRDKERKDQLPPKILLNPVSPVINSNTVIPTISSNNYTERYLSMYYLSILQQELMKLEQRLNGSINDQVLELPPAITNTNNLTVNKSVLPSPSTYFRKQINGIDLPFIPSLFHHLNNVLYQHGQSVLDSTTDQADQYQDQSSKISYKKKQVFTVKHYYIGQAGNFTYYRFPLIKGDCYDIKYFYSPVVGTNSFKANLYLVLKGKKGLNDPSFQIFSMGIEEFPKDFMYPGYHMQFLKSKNSTDLNQELDQDFPFTKELDQNADRIIKKLLKNRNDYRTERCFRKPKDQQLISNQYLEHSHNKEDCIRLNGIWDQPCTKSTKCPYFKNDPRGSCNQMTGYCNLPKGMKHASYHYADETTHPLCADCPVTEENFDNPDYKCCKSDKEPKYIW